MLNSPNADWKRDASPGRRRMQGMQARTLTHLSGRDDFGVVVPPTVGKAVVNPVVLPHLHPQPRLLVAQKSARLLYHARREERVAFGEDEAARHLDTLQVRGYLNFSRVNRDESVKAGKGDGESTSPAIPLSCELMYSERRIAKSVTELIEQWKRLSLTMTP